MNSVSTSRRGDHRRLAAGTTAPDGDGPRRPPTLDSRQKRARDHASSTVRRRVVMGVPAGQDLPSGTARSSSRVLGPKAQRGWRRPWPLLDHHGGGHELRPPVSLRCRVGWDLPDQMSSSTARASRRREGFFDQTAGRTTPQTKLIARHAINANAHWLAISRLPNGSAAHTNRGRFTERGQPRHYPLRT